MAEGEAKMLVNTMSFTTPGQYKVCVCVCVLCTFTPRHFGFVCTRYVVFVRMKLHGLFACRYYVHGPSTLREVHK